ncbi:histone chaperone [Friedmanniomyces endolithicus]|uniref:Histone chaperone n=1 Tax=Friedmanniomyces endolithicus TaxID=329885 RepID=A0AAN6KD75_9PEZI|nr:histone chaperone [Friedmanniomyces endolithicus]KAK0837424.1 histone chaperone [Friedmanniomyces endolithicus]KAK0917509.1 histone chaperone [Friedmanniomyces endolithicus]KAK0976240.1 histone chaperone [Friedmanniomyces endolithicus]
MSAIPNRRGADTAPTPQNTPANNAPISSRAQAPDIPSINEEDLDRAAAASIFAQNPKLVSMMQNKLQGLVGRSSGYVESLPGPVRKRVAGLKGVQKEHSKLEAEFQEEVLQLEKRFFAKFTPLYEKRAKIVNGQAEPTEAEITAGEEDEEEDEDAEGDKAEADKKAESEGTTAAKGIPEFWLSAMKNSSLQETITDRDEDALKTLTDIRMEYLDRPGFRLIFQFAENEFFSNKTLSKTYYYQEESGYGGDFIYDHAEGDKIDWKSGKDLTVKVESKKQRNKNTKQTRIVKKTIPTPSFFDFFNPAKPPGDDDEEVDEEIEAKLELDYQLGEDIKEKLIPRAIDWFTGEALQFEPGMDDFDEDEFEDEDDDDDDDEERDEDDEEEDEDEEDGSKPKQETAECKQS